ncbi:molybdopterin-dependent oxidoreductase [Neobacillus mesonae]|uniref:molybdopterin-containing oxidoreductase family protein n=1 Tax=Neobacillus mesonae TaxID=1193713 RepID=UPI00203AC042|nr:molybdopterin-dependent oxidoreductase [Neobacillus mesonae]MCM3567319.1 molybdopterin-dependent oxidoreductase [Neobacillus mesonae]
MKTNINVCPHDCWDTCSMKVTVDENGKAVKIRGNQEHPVTKGSLCLKVNRYLDRVYHPDRILYPLKRTGKKGEGKFKRISWDEAIQTITGQFKKTIQTYGAEAVLPFSYGGTYGLLNYGSMDRRFFGKMGASTLARTFCVAAGGAALDETFGTKIGMDPEDMVHSELIIAWGINLYATNMHQVSIIEEARKKGAKLVVIDPYMNETAKKADLYLRIQPGTDSALALGIMHILIKEDLINHQYVNQYLDNFDRLKERAAEFPPEKAAAITGIAESKIIELARLYGQTQKSVIRCGFGIQRHTNGGEMVRSLAILPALTGAWEAVGGGFLLINWDYGFNFNQLFAIDIHQGNPREINCSQIASALHLKENPIHMMYVYNSNPAGVAPNTNQVIEGLLREDLYLVVHEQFMTDTCQYADIILPATTSLEQLDIHRSYWHLYIQLNEPAIKPLGESKSNNDTFRLLAKGMGYTDACFSDSDEDLIRQLLDSDHPYLKGITYEALKEKKFIKINVEGNHFMPFKKDFPTKAGKVEITMKNGSVINYTPIVDDSRFPLHFITPKAKFFLNSTFGNIDLLKKREKDPLLYMHPNDAEPRGIQDGDEVLVFNNRGCITLPVKIGETSGPGVVISPINLWEKRVNVTTSDAITDIGGGATFYTNFVDVKKME